MGKVIVVDPKQLQNTASKIEALASDYKMLYNKLYSKTDDLALSWNGKDNVAFVEQIAGFRDDLDGMFKLMMNYVDFLRQSAKAYIDTQDAVVAEARKLVN